MPFWVIPAAIAGAQAIISGIQQHRQNKKNREMAEYQNDANVEFQREQNEYNTPQNQMLRFQQAGLNPHLIYGQGNPGNQSAPVHYPEMKPHMPANLDGIGSLLNQSMLAQSQVSALDAKTMQTHAMTELNKMQKDLMAKNPLFDDEGFKAIIDGLKLSAVLKSQESRGLELTYQFDKVSLQHRANKVFQEWENLEKQFKLMDADEKIKAQVLKSKEFQNEILRVQKEFMADGNIGPQQILQFIMLMFTKLSMP